MSAMIDYPGNFPNEELAGMSSGECDANGRRELTVPGAITDFSDEGLWREAERDPEAQYQRVLRALGDAAAFRPELREAVIAVGCNLPYDSPRAQELDNAWQGLQNKRFGMRQVD